MSETLSQTHATQPPNQSWLETLASDPVVIAIVKAAVFKKMTEVFGKGWQNAVIDDNAPQMVQVRQERKLRHQKDKQRELEQEVLTKILSSLWNKFRNVGQDLLNSGRLTYTASQKLIKLARLFKAWANDPPNHIPPRFCAKSLDKNGAIDCVDIRGPFGSDRIDQKRRAFQEHMDNCLALASAAVVIDYGEEDEDTLLITYNPGNDFGATVAMLHPDTARDIGVDIDITDGLQFIEVALPVSENTLNTKLYFSVLPNPEVIKGGVQLPAKWQTSLYAGMQVEVRYMPLLPNPVSIFVHHHVLGSEYNHAFVDEDDQEMTIALSTDEFQMQKTTIATGDTFTTLGAGTFSITKIWAASPDGGPPYELPAAGLSADMEVEIIFEKVAALR
jgi:hypothetical protein